MGELFFVIKGFALTLLVTLILQVKIGPDTLETRTQRWVQGSMAGQFVNDTAAGAVKAIQRGYQWTYQKVSGVTPSKLEDSTNQIQQLGPLKIHTRHKQNSGEQNAVN